MTVDETFILARSADRREKEKAMHERFIERLEELAKIKSGDVVLLPTQTRQGHHNGTVRPSAEAAQNAAQYTPELGRNTSDKKPKTPAIPEECEGLRYCTNVQVAGSALRSSGLGWGGNFPRFITLKVPPRKPVAEL